VHPRRKILNALANITLGEPGVVFPISEVGENVYTNRPTVLWKAELPAILFYGLKETSENKLQPKYYDRKLHAVAEIMVEASENADVLADTIAEKLENLLLHQRFLPDPTYDYDAFSEGATSDDFLPEENPANTCDDIEMIGTDIVLVSEHVDLPIVSLRISLEISYSTTPDYDFSVDKFDTMRQTFKQNEEEVSDFSTGIYHD
jgi:hypothetical protein